MQNNVKLDWPQKYVIMMPWLPSSECNQKCISAWSFPLDFRVGIRNKRQNTFGIQHSSSWETEECTMVILLLFCIIPAGVFSSVENPVFSFQKDGIFDNESTQEWAKLNNEMPELAKATICTWLKIHFHRYENTVWTYCIEDEDSNLICSGLGNSFRQYLKIIQKVSFYKLGKIETFLMRFSNIDKIRIFS